MDRYGNAGAPDKKLAKKLRALGLAPVAQPKPPRSHQQQKKRCKKGKKGKFVVITPFWKW